MRAKAMAARTPKIEDTQKGIFEKWDMVLFNLSQTLGRDHDSLLRYPYHKVGRLISLANKINKQKEKRTGK